MAGLVHRRKPLSAEHRAAISVKLKGRSLSPETIAKMRQRVPWNKGKKGPPMLPHVKANLIAVNTGRRRSAETQAKLAGKVGVYARTPEIRAKIASALTGKKLSPETRAKLKAMRSTPEARLANSERNRGKKHKLETIAKMKATRNMPEYRKRASELQKGPRSSNWHGGISRLPYAFSFTPELKEQIRERDGHKCQLCGVPESECARPLSVHHVDYNKQNSDPVNLIALCVSCHSRTSYNRKHWQTLFQNMLIDRKVGKPLMPKQMLLWSVDS